MVTLRTMVRSVGVAMLLAAPAGAQHATQVIGFRIDPIDQISFTGSPTLVISAATAGQSPSSVRASGGTWSVTTNHTGARITASVNEELPPGLTLSVELAAPNGAQAEGLRALSATPVEVITNLSNTAARDLPLTYQLDARVTAGTVLAGTRTVIYTITAGM